MDYRFHNFHFAANFCKQYKHSAMVDMEIESRWSWNWETLMKHGIKLGDMKCPTVHQNLSKMLLFVFYHDYIKRLARENWTKIEAKNSYISKYWSKLHSCFALLQSTSYIHHEDIGFLTCVIYNSLNDY